MGIIRAIATDPSPWRCHARLALSGVLGVIQDREKVSHHLQCMATHSRFSLCLKTKESWFRVQAAVARKNASPVLERLSGSAGVWRVTPLLPLKNTRTARNFQEIENAIQLACVTHDSCPNSILSFIGLNWTAVASPSSTSSPT